MNLLLCGHNKTHYSTAYTLLNTAFYYALFEKKAYLFLLIATNRLIQMDFCCNNDIFVHVATSGIRKKLCKYSDY